MLRGCAAGVALMVSACRAPTQLTLVLGTDVPCTDLDGVSVTTGPLGEIERRPPTATTSTCGADGLVGSLVVVPSDAKDDELALRISAGFGRPVEECAAPYGAGCIVARRVLRFIPHESLTLHIELDVDCAGIPCGATETCRHGACTDAHVDSSGCTGAGCGDDALASPSVPAVAGCGDLSGLQRGAPFAMNDYCPTRIARSPFPVWLQQRSRHGARSLPQWPRSVPRPLPRPAGLTA